MRQGHGWYWEQVSAKLIERDPELNPIRMVGYHKDITKRKEINENLRKSGRLLQEAQAIAKVGSWEYDLQTKNFWASDEGFNIFWTEAFTIQLALHRRDRGMHSRERPSSSGSGGFDQRKTSHTTLSTIFSPLMDQIEKTIVSKAQIEHDDNGNPRRVTGL